MKNAEEYCLLPLGWDASPLQGYPPPPQQYVAITHLYTWLKKDKVEWNSLSKETMWWVKLEPQTSRSRVQFEPKKICETYEGKEVTSIVTGAKEKTTNK